MFTVIVDRFDALNHFKTTSPWIGIVNIWLTNHSPGPLRALNIFDSRTFFTYFKANFWFCHQIIPLGKSFSSKKPNFRVDVWWKPFDLVWPYNVIRSIKAPKTHSIIFSKSTMVVTHNRATGLLAAKWLSKTKTCSNQFSPFRDVPLKQQRGTFVHIYQN